MNSLRNTSIKKRGFGLNCGGKGKLEWPFLVLLAVWVLVSAAQAKYGGGSGTAESPYEIRTPEQMNAIGADSNDWDKHFRLMANIDLGGYTGTAFNIIGNSTTKFTGVFDGNDNQISNFTYSSTGTYYIGLFGYVSGGEAEIKDLHLIDPNVLAGTGSIVGSLAGCSAYGSSISGCTVEGGNVSGNSRVGGLVGSNLESTLTNSTWSGSVLGDDYVGGLVGSNSSGGTVTDCSATGTVSGADDYVGGLAGSNSSGGTVADCSATGSVTGDRSVGGLVGSNSSGSTVADCSATGTVSGTGDYVGGLVGYSHGMISQSCATGDVSGHDDVGGLVGYINDNGVCHGRISRCYSAGPASGNTYVGGLVGTNGYGTVEDCFWDKDTSGLSNMCGRSSGTGCDDAKGKTTAQMRMAATFTSAGWDFVQAWKICEGTDYPRLVWQIPLLGDLLCPRGVDFVDFASFAAHWLDGDCNESNVYCGDTDLDRAGAVDKVKMRKQVHNDIRDIFNAPDRQQAEQRLKSYVAKHEKTAAKLSVWMEENLPESLTVFALPEGHRKRMRTTNMLERVHEEINRRTRVAGLFPNEASLLRLVSAVLMELSEEWETGKRYLNMDVGNNDSASEQNKIYRKKVA